MFLYGHPVDQAAFDAYVESTHIPLVKKVRGLTGWTISKFDPGLDGTSGPYYLVGELYAPSREAWLEILDSPEGKTASADLSNFATGGVTILFGEVQTMIPVQA